MESVLPKFVADACATLQSLLAQRAAFDRIAAATRLREEAGDISAIEHDRVEVERLKAKGELDLAIAAVTSRKSDLGKLLNWPDQAMDFVAEDAWPKAVARYLATPEKELVARFGDEYLAYKKRTKMIIPYVW